MSYQGKHAQTEAQSFQEEKPNSGFERHILHTCAADEWDLRKFMKRLLTKANFRLIEDNYKSERVGKDKRYGAVHNLLAIRGNNPKVCLVAHTDVCRDHGSKSSSSSSSISEWTAFEEFVGQKLSRDEYQSYRAAAGNQDEPYKLTPVIKNVSCDGEVRRIIQDKFCKFQVGGDDRLGVAINTWIALNTGYDMALYFPTDEEIGLKSARACEMEELKDFEVLVQVDRGNHSRELVLKINSEFLCSYEVGTRLLDIAHRIGLPRDPVTGAGTDVYALKSKGLIKNAVNMTCGYHNSHGSDPTEYIEIAEARDTMKYVAAIIQDYDLHGV